MKTKQKKPKQSKASATVKFPLVIEKLEKKVRSHKATATTCARFYCEV
jgi:hypothetical protein